MQMPVDVYTTFELAYASMNRLIFADALPAVMFSIGNQPNSYAYFSKNQTVNRDLVTRVHHIQFNSATLISRDTRLLFATLLHEMVHCWEVQNETASRSGYHNKVWGEKMLSVGLVPCKPDGTEALCGQKMTHKIQAGGAYDHWYNQFGSKLTISWTIDFSSSLAPAPTDGDEDENESATVDEDEKAGNDKKTASKVKFSYPHCKANVWGKPSVRVMCANCLEEYTNVLEAPLDFSVLQSFLMISAGATPPPAPAPRHFIGSVQYGMWGSDANRPAAALMYPIKKGDRRDLVDYIANANRPPNDVLKDNKVACVFALYPDGTNELIL